MGRIHVVFALSLLAAACFFSSSSQALEEIPVEAAALAPEGSGGEVRFFLGSTNSDAEFSFAPTGSDWTSETARLQDEAPYIEDPTAESTGDFTAGVRFTFHF